MLPKLNRLDRRSVRICQLNYFISSIKTRLCFKRRKGWSAFKTCIKIIKSRCNFGLITTICFKTVVGKDCLLQWLFRRSSRELPVLRPTEASLLNCLRLSSRKLCRRPINNHRISNWDGLLNRYNWTLLQTSPRLGLLTSWPKTPQQLLLLRIALLLRGLPNQLMRRLLSSWLNYWKMPRPTCFSSCHSQHLQPFKVSSKIRVWN